jgi:UDP-GlcNAc:undecaprenyl-phosphate GlcNAc-1-phosphate transferase
MLKYLILFLAACGISFALTPAVRSFAKKIGVMDLPGERKLHGRPIPRLGGLAIFITFHLVLLVSYRFSFFFFPQGFLDKIHFEWLFGAALIVFSLGVLDDLRGVSPGTKFIVQLIAASLVALYVYRIEVISLGFWEINLGLWSIPVTVFWIVAITNAVNLLDGLDGLAAGTSFIAALSMFGICILNENIGFALVSIILAGSVLGFLRYNFHPASIFLGDSGSYTLGFLFSILSLHSNLKGTTTVIILVPILVLGLPLMDTLLSALRRLLKSFHILEFNGGNRVKIFFGKSWSIFSADRDHIHHRLLKLGFSQKNAVVFLYTITVLLGGIALASVYFTNVNQALLISALGIASYIGVQKLGYSEIQFLRNGTLLPLFDSPLVSRRMLKVFLDVGALVLAYYLAFLLRYEGELTPAIKRYYLSTMPLAVAVKLLIFNIAGLYHGTWRYVNVDDFLRILKAVFFGCAVAALLFWIVPSLGITSWAILLIDFNLLFLLIAGSRSSFRILEHLHLSQKNRGKKVLIYGVEREGVHALNEFLHNPRLGLMPVGFIEDGERNNGKEVNGCPVLGGLDTLEKTLKDYPVSEIIVSRDNLSQKKMDCLIQICKPRQITLRRFHTRLEKIINEEV